jgi:hypothetical protein
VVSPFLIRRKEWRNHAWCPSPPVMWASTHIQVTCTQLDAAFTEKQKWYATELLCTVMISLRSSVQLRALRVRSPRKSCNCNVAGPLATVRHASHRIISDNYLSMNKLGSIGMYMGCKPTCKMSLCFCMPQPSWGFVSNSKPNSNCQQDFSCSDGANPARSMYAITKIENLSYT